MPTAQQKLKRLEQLIDLYGTDDVEEIARAMNCTVDEVTLDHLPNMGGDAFDAPPVPLLPGGFLDRNGDYWPPEVVAAAWKKYRETTTAKTSGPSIKLSHGKLQPPLTPRTGDGTIRSAVLSAAVASVVDGMKHGLR